MSKINMIADHYTVVGYESITITATVQSLTEAAFTDGVTGELADRAIITVEDAQIRYRIDGTDPTSSQGHLINPFSVIVLHTTRTIRDFRAIRATSTNATIRITYERS